MPVLGGVLLFQSQKIPPLPLKHPVCPHPQLVSEEGLCLKGFIRKTWQIWQTWQTQKEFRRCNRATEWKENNLFKKKKYGAYFRMFTTCQLQGNEPMINVKWPVCVLGSDGSSFSRAVICSTAPLKKRVSYYGGTDKSEESPILHYRNL